MAKADWIDRAAACADGMVEIIRARYPDVKEERDPDGKSIGHLYFMALTLCRRELDSDTKACRWLGYLQAALVFLGLPDLETEKERNLASGDVHPTPR